jgi:alkanesulfonate monooxygenase SsuD/methylene tetrahydromethanopterin reductase-like flavin-dependent oxidoreductase (luciferase family)
MTLVSLTGPQFSSSFQPMLDWARFAEDSGFDGVFLFDHLVPLGDARRPVLELAASLGAIAATTSRIGVGSLVMRAPMRGPGISAAIAATAAAVAPGRITIGLGAGDRLSVGEDERFGRATARLDERLSAVRSTVESIRATGIEASIWVGGIHPRVRELAGEVADGWNGWMVDVDSFSEMASGLPAGVAATWGGAVIVGRDGDDVAEAVRRRGSEDGALVGTVAQVAGRLAQYVEAGASHLVLSVLPNRADRWEVAADLRVAIG